MRQARRITTDYNPRFFSRTKRYRYRLLLDRVRHPLERTQAWRVGWKLDLDLLRREASLIEGTHDFAAFRSQECQSKTSVRRLERIKVRRTGDYVWLEITANAYLHHMVRNIVGTLIAVQRAAEPAAAMARVLVGRDRRMAGVTAPAAGLYLWHVEYPPVYGIPAPQLDGAPAGAWLMQPAGLLR